MELVKRLLQVPAKCRLLRLPRLQLFQMLLLLLPALLRLPLLLLLLPLDLLVVVVLQTELAGLGLPWHSFLLGGLQLRSPKHCILFQLP
jgi:hypothetical protein